MNQSIKIIRSEKPEWGTIGGGLSTFNKSIAGPPNSHSLCFVLQTPDDEILGGVIGEIHWNWLNIDLMWISEEHRGQGFGKQLLQTIEDEARKLGALHAYLDTFSFQAPGFYQKFGYEIIGKMKDFPQGHKRVYMTKDL